MPAGFESGLLILMRDLKAGDRPISNRNLENERKEGIWEQRESRFLGYLSESWRWR